MANDVFHRSQGYPDRRLMHPRREWGVGIFFFVLVTVVGSVVAGNIFVTYKNISVVAGDSGNSIPQYRNVLVQDALEMYRLKEQEHQTLQGTKIPAVVPIATTTEVSPQAAELTEAEQGEGRPEIAN